jgi:hypothetical protein
MTVLTQVIFPLMLLASPFVIGFIVVNKINPGNLSYKLAVGLALITAFLLIWMNLAVGIIGSEDNGANLMFVGIFFIGLIAALNVRFQSLGMSYVMLVMVLLHIIVAVIELIFQFGILGPIWPFDVIGASCLFSILWFASALLFRKAAQVQFAEFETPL